jgi:hypothetical protein
MLPARQIASPLQDAALAGSAPGAEALAHAYLDYVCECWCGDNGATQFEKRLATFLDPDLPPEPADPADAYSPHGAGGAGIQWFECGDEILGYVPGSAVGYRIPVHRIAELVHAARARVELPAANVAGIA